MSVSDPCVVTEVARFRKMLADGTGLFAELDGKRRREDERDTTAALLASRALKFFDAYTCLVEAGLGEPAAAVLRSLYETSLMLRWVLADPGKAKGYRQSGRDEASRIVSRVGGVARRAGQPLPTVPSGEATPGGAVRPPSYDRMATSVGLKDLHGVVYNLLSAFSHGNPLGFGLGLARGEVTVGRTTENLAPLFPVANNVFLDCLRVYETWIVRREVHPAPDMVDLLGREDAGP